MCVIGPNSAFLLGFQWAIDDAAQCDTRRHASDDIVPDKKPWTSKFFGSCIYKQQFQEWDYI